MTERQLRALHEGYNACEAWLLGKGDMPDNPYLRTMEEFEYWNKGWHNCYEGE